jgi:hypothetical protein
MHIKCWIILTGFAEGGTWHVLCHMHHGILSRYALVSQKNPNLSSLSFLKCWFVTLFLCIHPLLPSSGIETRISVYQSSPTVWDLWSFEMLSAIYVRIFLTSLVISGTDQITQQIPANVKLMFCKQKQKMTFSLGRLPSLAFPVLLCVCIF